jgi:hypothetical protein
MPLEMGRHSEDRNVFVSDIRAVVAAFDGAPASSIFCWPVGWKSQTGYVKKQNRKPDRVYRCKVNRIAEEFEVSRQRKGTFRRHKQKAKHDHARGNSKRQVHRESKIDVGRNKPQRAPNQLFGIGGEWC